MPRTVDLDDRRRIVGEAAWRVLVRDGPTEVSVRKVAAEAGLPPSSLRYTFPTQASVRDAAVSLLVSRLRERVARAASATGGHDAARAVLLELLPLDDERRAEMEVTVAFAALALTDASLRAAHEQTHAAVHDVCALALAHLDADVASAGAAGGGGAGGGGAAAGGGGGGAAGGPATRAPGAPATAGVDVELTHAVVDGLALHLLAQVVGTDASWAVTALDAHLALLALRR
ncbi:TetR/AcrR family transcriptional regulator [Frigoribacterium sp. PvP032]|uniref:TetR/AcrR family transcriptional regulator n=1 Tax=Frigoribacterium sp. PvP032 TaxID=2806589 RepID=UPI001AE2B223|nr:TetR family transcriptional regulator C-terminal domain-containing protein [Frigoribacterium sp. PvP032]MBP1189536.1 AcrR family transcriptional regulator [Frigoribacterium sp. PvP032]